MHDAYQLFSYKQLDNNYLLNYVTQIINPHSNIVEKRVGKSPQEISTRPTFRNILTKFKGTRYNQNGIVRRYRKYIGLYLPDE